MLSLHPDDIEIGERHRTLSKEAVSRLALSMKEIGLRHPVTIRVAEEMMVEGKVTSGVPVLVAGAHRLAAAKELGWDSIDCVEVADDSVEAELWELSENLHRLDLSREQRDEHIRRYAELLKARKPRQNVAVSGGRGNKGVPQQIAEETGLNVRTVQRALAPKRHVIEVPDQLDHDDMIELQVRALMTAWNKACPEARDLFLGRIDTPVMDRVA